MLSTVGGSRAYKAESLGKASGRHLEGTGPDGPKSTSVSLGNDIHCRAYAIMRRVAILVLVQFIPLFESGPALCKIPEKPLGVAVAQIFSAEIGLSGRDRPLGRWTGSWSSGFSRFL